MITLHLGVIDIPYGDEESGEATTGDVAEILEAKYHIMQVFFDRYHRDIGDVMADSLAGQLENIIAGMPPSSDPMLEAMGKIHDMFSNFLETQQMNGLPGVPTQAALDGVSKRFKVKFGPPRPSFIDTGTYQAAMRAWVSGVLNAFPK
ncbi:hypothetical protein [Yersinia intermedia]|uniref:hypothetical protein n=1 Tax=Yersinia intermedia TaxID=631 RepID=UPI001CFE897B|nr:hypothetical protein [Yersinia intermedia]MCB5329279.1 hypothetical protein [Yersinia intermedia]